MSHNNNYHNYQNYSSNNYRAEEKPDEVKVEDPVSSEIAEDVTEDIAEVTEAETETAPVIEVVKPKVGIVTGCIKLNVRKAASPTAEILGVIEEGSEVQIDNDFNAPDFYKVSAATGLEGFCMKKFITVK